MCRSSDTWALCDESTDIQGILDTWEEAEESMKPDLLRQYGEDSFIELDKDEIADEISASGPKGEEFRLCIQPTDRTVGP